MSGKENPLPTLPGIIDSHAHAHAHVHSGDLAADLPAVLRPRPRGYRGPRPPVLCKGDVGGGRPRYRRKPATGCM